MSENDPIERIAQFLLGGSRTLDGPQGPEPLTDPRVPDP